MRHPSFVIGFSPSRLLAVFCVAALWAVASMPALAACDKDPECDDVSAWAAFTRITLEQSAPGSDETTEWLSRFNDKTSDISIDITTRGGKKPMAGTVGMVSGQIMLSKGLKLEPGYEIDAMDAPVLSIKLLLAMLHRAFPNGPAQITGPMNVNYTGRAGIRFATPSADGYIPAPWHVTGKVSRRPDGAIPFELALSFSMPTQRQSEPGSRPTIRLKGELAKLNRPVFQDADSLAGWTVYGVGPQITKQGSGTILDYGAKPQQNAPYQTIGDIRAFIAAQNNPGVKDASKDFTGFWKEKCADSFGLQIKHQGDEGQYSVVFCGPGGCGDPSESRPTFITGDKNYEVVSEDELIRIVRQAGKRMTYHRCTKDPNPVPKRQNQSGSK